MLQNFSCSPSDLNLHGLPDLDAKNRKSATCKRKSIGKLGPKIQSQKLALSINIKNSLVGTT